MRQRNIRPGFWDNPELAACGIEAMLFFVGLWCYADREGRAKDEPRRILAHVFPYHSEIDAGAIIDRLVEAGFVESYAVDGCYYLWIPMFAEHQHPHQREAASVLPEYVEGTAKATPRSSLGTAKATPRLPEHGARNTEGQDHQGTYTPDDDASILPFFETAVGRTLSGTEPTRLKQLVEVYGLAAVKSAVPSSAEADRPIPYMTSILHKWASEPAVLAAASEPVEDYANMKWGVPGE